MPPAAGLRSDGKHCVVLLPERRRFAGQEIALEFARALGRADWTATGRPGERQQLLRHFNIRPAGWPMAAITRHADIGDAAGFSWLRADPAYVRAETAGVRLMAWANLGLDDADAEIFLDTLRPLFADHGMVISAGACERWFLQLAVDCQVPGFSPPADAMGEDLLGHLPQGPEGSQWRGLLNEAQVMLHNHPHNQSRIAAGLLPVNSLWFWGAGVLPDAVECALVSLDSSDAELNALGSYAGMRLASGEVDGALLDMRHVRSWQQVERDALAPMLGNAGRRGGALVLDFADGHACWLHGSQRWRVWRPRLSTLDAA